MDHTERNGRQDDHQRYANAHSRVGVVPAIVLGKPDDQRGCHDTEIVGCIAQNVQEDSHHTQISMVVPVSVLVAVTVTMAVVVTVGRNGALRFLKSHMLVIVMLDIVSILIRVLMGSRLTLAIESSSSLLGDTPSSIAGGP
jgi:hypothetical protein